MVASTHEALERSALKKVLAINLGQCVAGIALGTWAGSTALIGAALDNLADSSVYAVSLYSIGRVLRFKVLAATLSGWLLIGLAGLLLIEVIRRFFGAEETQGAVMIGMAALNFALNLVCLRILSAHRGHGVHFRAASVFTSNDSVVNFGIAVSGALVMWLGSNWPDLIVGIIVACIAARGGIGILNDAAKTRAADHS